MTRKRRRRSTTTAVAKPTFRTTAGWQWRSFPVFFAFACGIFLMGLLSVEPGNTIGVIVFYIALFGVAFGAAHIVTRWLAEWRMRRQAPAPEAERDAKEHPHVSEGAPRRR